ncbi:hypothetical protein SESBI_09599 [Sesbania bispinosa]|nr:hypothetical protein SESBI_09599 [Sesbania bispinosa]
MATASDLTARPSRHTTPCHRLSTGQAPPCQKLNARSFPEGGKRRQKSKKENEES